MRSHPIPELVELADQLVEAVSWIRVVGVVEVVALGSPIGEERQRASGVDVVGEEPTGSRVEGEVGDDEGDVVEPRGDGLAGPWTRCIQALYRSTGSRSQGPV